VHLRLGVMDVIGRWPTYLLLFFVFVVSTFIMIVPVNSATTATAPDFIHYMGIGPVDLRVDLSHADDTSAARFSQAVDQLEADPDVSAIAPMVTTRNDTVDRDGNPTSLYIENGDHTRLPLRYADGRARPAARRSRCRCSPSTNPDATSATRCPSRSTGRSAI
jgi:putative ABC transport system permease protein